MGGDVTGAKTTNYASALDPTWPPVPPPEGTAARLLEYLIRYKSDPFFKALRLFGNVKLPKGGPVFVTRFRDVIEVLDRPEVFTVKPYAPMMDPTLGPFMLDRDGTVFNERDKGIMRASMGRQDLPLIREMVRDLTEKCIDEHQEDGLLEVVNSVSRRVAVLLIGEYFGFPGPDLESMFRWSRATQHDMFHNQAMSGTVHDDNIREGAAMRAYVKDELLPARRKELETDASADDVVARLLKTSFPESIGFDETRLVTSIMGILIGGVETTSAAIVQLLDQLLIRPKELAGAISAAKANDDMLLFQYCWEALRFNPVNPLVTRSCAKNYRIASGTMRNTLIEKNRIVFACTRSAMMDPRELPKPREFRTDRPREHYMHLGYGSHTCLGDQVSWVVVPGVIKQLILRPEIRRLGDINMDGGPFPEQYHISFKA